MRVRPIDLDREYATLKTWWEGHGLAAPPLAILQGGHGFAVAHDGLDLVAGWIYVSNRGVVAFVEWATSAPGAKGVKAALTMLYDFFEVMAHDSGCLALFTTTPEGSSLRRLLEGEEWVHCPGPAHVHLMKALA